MHLSGDRRRGACGLREVNATIMQIDNSIPVATSPHTELRPTVILCAPLQTACNDADAMISSWARGTLTASLSATTHTKRTSRRLKVATPSMRLSRRPAGAHPRTVTNFPPPNLVRVNMPLSQLLDSATTRGHTTTQIMTCPLMKAVDISKSIGNTYAANKIELPDTVIQTTMLGEIPFDRAVVTVVDLRHPLMPMLSQNIPSEPSSSERPLTGAHPSITQNQIFRPRLRGTAISTCMNPCIQHRVFVTPAMVPPS